MPQLDERIVPYNMDAEKAVCGSLLIDGDIISDLRYIIQPGDFFTSQNKSVYTACGKIADRGIAINQITVAKELASTKELEGIGGIAYLSHLVAEVPTSLHAEYYARIVKETSIARKLITMGSKIQELGYSETDPVKMITESEKMLLEVEKDIAMPKLITPVDLAKRGTDYYTTLQQGKRKGVFFGFKELDEMIGGLFGGELCYIAGRPSSAKTDIALSIGEYVGLNFGNVLLVSLEQPWEEILDRFTSRKLKITPRHLRLGNYNDDLFGSITSYMGEIAEKGLYFYDTGGDIDGKGSTTSSVFSIANHMKLAYGLRLIIIDYIQLMEDEAREQLRERITTISKKCKRLARSLDVPVIALCQLNREVEHRNDHHAILSDMRESGSLEQDGDLILFTYRGEKYGDVSKVCQKLKCDIFGINEITIAKHRQNGEVADTVIPLLWNYKERHYVDPKDKGIKLIHDDILDGDNVIGTWWCHSDITKLPEDYRPRSAQYFKSPNLTSVPDEMK